MKAGFIGIRKVTILGALLLATLMTGCFDGGWGGGGPGYYQGYGGGYPSYGGGYPSNYYSTNVYRGYGGYSQPGLFGGYPPAHEAWDASTRGRTSYGGGGGEHRGGGGEHRGGGGEHRGGGGGEHGHDH
ncbi:MAG TPA: hypothetical protein VNE63_01840 [Candidatus Acidoferrales bacterium]|nr:hypothetical protein [Candidatus Acidoferrales bacterium]